jgi:hypothetical protein
MKIMAHDSSASLRKGTSNGRKSTAKTNNASPKQANVIDASIKRRARLLITDSAIPRQTRLFILDGLERRDRYLAQVVERVEAGELIIDHIVLDEDHAKG